MQHSLSLRSTCLARRTFQWTDGSLAYSRRPGPRIPLSFPAPISKILPLLCQHHTFHEGLSPAEFNHHLKTVACLSWAHVDIRLRVAAEWQKCRARCPARLSRQGAEGAAWLGSQSRVLGLAGAKMDHHSKVGGQWQSSVTMAMDLLQ